MLTRRKAHRSLPARAAFAMAGGLLATLTLADTSHATAPDKAQPPTLPQEGEVVDLEVVDLEAVELERELSDKARATRELREVIGRRSQRRIDSLAVPLFSDHSEALWPMQVGIEVASASGEIVLPLSEVVVADGQHTVFSDVIEAPRGSHNFELEIVARHHIGAAIELEYDLAVRQAHFSELTWGNYFLHRLSLAPRPELGPNALAAARADIVEIQERVNEPAHRQMITVDGQRYEIRLYASTLRG